MIFTKSFISQRRLVTPAAIRQRTGRSQDVLPFMFWLLCSGLTRLVAPVPIRFIVGAPAASGRP
jgi:hypothetical protein